jgi:O-antigen/teichoic acid export membrane protein
VSADTIRSEAPRNRKLVPRAPAVRRMVSNAVNDSLYRNSSFLILNTAITAALGFVFWAMASRFFPPSAVGTTATVVSAFTFVAMAGTLGLPNAVIRFLASNPDPVRFVATAAAVAAGSGAGLALVWCAVPNHFGVPLDRVAPGAALVPVMVVITALGSVGVIAQSAIIALRKSKWVVVENTAASIMKLILLPLGVGLGAAGLFGLYFVAVAVAAVASLLILRHEIGGSVADWARSIELRCLTHCRSFAAGNHVAALVALLPTTVLPIIVLDRLGARQAAFFAMPLMIVALLNVIPSMASQSLFAEASADEPSLGAHARRTLLGVYAVLIPGVVALCVLAAPVLSIFGAAYARNGTRCLQLLALSGVFAGFNYVADVVLNARKQVKRYVFLNTAGTACAIGFPVAFMGSGLTGVGVGWLVGQVGYALLAVATLTHAGAVPTRRASERVTSASAVSEERSEP